MGVILWMIAIILFLAIIGLGWKTFFAGVLKGIDKLGITPIIKNITDTTKKSLTEILETKQSQNSANLIF
jgi:uncharacterized membrane protein